MTRSRAIRMNVDFANVVVGFNRTAFDTAPTLWKRR